MTAALATLAEAADMKRWAGATLGMNADDSIAERVIALCAGYERLAEALKEAREYLFEEGHGDDEGGDPDCDGCTLAASLDALLTQLGATP